MCNIIMKYLKITKIQEGKMREGVEMGTSPQVLIYFCIYFMYLHLERLNYYKRISLRPRFQRKQVMKEWRENSHQMPFLNHLRL